jgi:phosphoglycerate kinase
MPKLTLRDISLSNKKVIMRVDFNVPLKNGKIVDVSRIKAALPSIKYILDQKASLILMSHLGRPKGRDETLCLKPCQKRLEELLKTPIIMAPDSVGREVENIASNLKPSEIMLLENLRFHEGEKHPEKDPSFAENLAKLADIYVNDAFGTAHRKHSSTYTITKFFQGKAVLGFLFEKEIKNLKNLLTSKETPFFAIIGGSKISTKMGVILKLLEKVDALFIGGGMVFTFLKANGYEIGDSIFEEQYVPQIENILKKSKDTNTPIYLPNDIVVEDQSNNVKIVSNDNIPPNSKGMDIGPETIKIWEEKLKEAKKIFWNGPLGVIEIEKFAKGTNAIIKILSSLNALTVVGGGDSIAAINKMHLQEKFSYLSTGGGASLEFIENETLPGIEALSDK